MDKMIIVSLTLINYTRMSVGRITKLVFTPEESYVLQLILGTNGTGKSSLLWELWMLPGEASDFGVGGRKELVVHYKGAEYVLISDFSGSKPQHQFIVDGVDMNDGGKIEMCRTLCYENFGVTNEIRSLAMEQEVLTEMSPARRRYWMIKLADSDFTYAMNVYNKLKDAHRDATGAIRRLQKRHVDELNKVVPEEVVKQLGDEVQEIRDLINEVYSMRNTQTRKHDEITSDLVGVTELLDRNCNDIERLNLEALEASGYESREQMVDQREKLKMEVYSTQQMSHHLFEQHTKIRKKYEVLIKAGTESISELTEKMVSAKEHVAYKQSFLAMPHIVFDSDPSEMQRALEAVYTDLIDLINQLPSNEGEFSSEKANRSEGTLYELNHQYNRLGDTIAKLGADIAHKRDHVNKEILTCPSCKHSWSEKASEDDLIRAEKRLEELKAEHKMIGMQMDDIRKYLKDFSEYSSQFRAVTTTIRSVPILAPYLNDITQNNRLVKYPKSVAADLFVVRSDIEHHVEISVHKKIIAQVSEQIELKKNLDADTLESIEEEMEGIERSVGACTQKLNELQAKSKEVDILLGQFDQTTRLNSDLLKHRDMQSAYVKELIYSRYQELLWLIIMTLQTSLARKEDALNAAKSQQAIVDQIALQLEEAHMNERVAKAAHLALSPSNGAIAEGLHRFINVFVGRMNKIINSVWTYPLVIQPMRMEDGASELDYKFPFMANDEGKPKKDVDEGSKSMLGIFNFAFKFVALRQLKMDHLPLFFDEFETGFDDIHREKAIYLVKKLIDEKVAGQIFMVSHFESNHGALSGLGQVCVLSKDNLLLPSNMVYNEHVLIS